MIQTHQLSYEDLSEKDTFVSIVKLVNFRESFIFAKLRIPREGYIFAKLRMRSFVKIKPWRNGEITLSVADIGKSSPSHEFLNGQKCLITPFAKIKFSRKFSNL